MREHVPTERMPDLMLNLQRAVCVMAVIPKPIGGDRCAEDKHCCPSKLAHAVSPAGGLRRSECGLRAGAAVPSSPSTGDNLPEAVSRAKSDNEPKQRVEHAKRLSILDADEIRLELELVSLRRGKSERAAASFAECCSASSQLRRGVDFCRRAKPSLPVGQRSNRKQIVIGRFTAVDCRLPFVIRKK
jgi:hypothetical protein